MKYRLALLLPRLLLCSLLSTRCNYPPGGHIGAIDKVAINRDGHRVLGVASNQSVELCDAATGKPDLEGASPAEVNLDRCGATVVAGSSSRPSPGCNTSAALSSTTDSSAYLFDNFAIFACLMIVLRRL